ncbi:MAG: tetratricopeptide repeat protein [Magnetococcus sp. YQC-5]
MPSTNITTPQCKTVFILLFWLLTPLFSPALLAEEPDLVVLASGPETTELLRQIGEPLAMAAELPAKEIHFHVVLNSTLNAFAMLNRHIVLNSGLMLAVQDRDELAGVMAHEIAHLKAGHHLQLQAMSKKYSLQTMITAAAGILATLASRDTQIGQAVMTGGAASAQTSILEGIRRKEAQADRLAISLLSDAGFNPDGLAGFMNRLVRQQQISTLPPPYLLSHPISTERLMDTQRMAKEVASTQPRRPDATENQLLARAQAILEAETNASPEEAANQFRNRLKLDPDNLALGQGLAESLRSAGRLPEAETQCNAMLKTRPKDAYLLRQRGLIRIEMGKNPEAEQDLRAALALLPDNPDLRFRLAFVLKELKKPLDASRMLRQLTAQYPNDPRYFYLLGITDGQGGREGEAHIAMGRYYALIQDKKNALWHFQEAIRLLPPTSPDHAIAKSELVQTRKMEQEIEVIERKRR